MDSSSSLLFLFLYLALPTATSTAFNFPSFNTSTESIVFQNDSFLSNGAISLTQNAYDAKLTWNVGRAYYREPIKLHDAASGELADFTTHFSFIINNVSQSQSGQAEGLAFFLSPFPSVVPPNSAGGCLCLVEYNKSQNASANQFVAVEFDTFMNDWDPYANHVGINVNSIKSAATVKWGSSIGDGRKANGWISYNAKTMNLSVFLTYENNPIFVGNSSLFHIVNLSKILPEEVAVGFSASTGDLVETHTILSWEFSSTRFDKKNRVGLIVGVALGTGLLLVAAGFMWIFLWRKKKAGNLKGEEDDDEVIDEGEFERGRGPKRFPLGELAAATRDFADELKLGQGGFGGVYRGFLAESNVEVAIKRVSEGSKQGKKEYISEVKIISRLRHRNLVQLVGWCHERKELLLVYEFMPNGSLDSYLYSRDSKKCLAWPLRYKIALGLASALLYLHEEWEECVVHRDVKPSNVMLDGGFNAKLGDFGLARLVDHERGSQTTMLAGTMGYLAPEIVITLKASKETDVYSFGIVALELAAGRHPVEQKRPEEQIVLVSWVWGLYGRGALLEAADERLNLEFDEGEMARLMIVGLWCSHPDSALRPSIRQAMAALKLETPLPELPESMPVPTYYASPLEMCRFTDTSSSSAAGGSMGVLSVSSDYITTGSDVALSAATDSSSTTASFLKSKKLGT